MLITVLVALLCVIGLLSIGLVAFDKFGRPRSEPRDSVLKRDWIVYPNDNQPNRWSI